MKQVLRFLALAALLAAPWGGYFNQVQAQQSLPYSYGFENNNLATDGWLLSGATSDETGISSDAAQNGSCGFAFNYDEQNAYLLSPIFTGNTAALSVTFSYTEYSDYYGDEQFYVGYTTDASNTDPTTYTYGAIVTASTSWQEYENTFPAGTKRIAIKYVYNDCYYLYLDDFTFEVPSSCAKPTALAAGSVTATGATLTWTAGGSETDWTVEYGTAADFTGAASNVSTTPTLALTGLTPATTYYVRVKAVCGVGDESNWSTAASFTTSCVAITAAGYTQNFDDLTAGDNVLPVCWSYINTTTYSYYQGYPSAYADSYYSTYSHSASNCLYFYSYYSSYSDYDPQPQYAILPEMTGLAGKQVTLWAKGYSATSTFKIGTMSDPADASTFSPITEQALTTSYQEFEYLVPTTTDAYLAIMIDAANSSRTTNGVYIDDISIAEPPSCLKPTDVTCSATTTTTATLGWTETGTATQWQVSVDDGTPMLVSTTPYTITGLTPATTYAVKVRAYCASDDQSEWSSPVSVTTKCEAVTAFPWTENFDALTVNNSIPTCWDNDDGTTTDASYKWIYNTSTSGNGATSGTGHSGNCIRFNSYSNSSNNTNFLKTIPLSLPASPVMQLSFWYKNPAGGDFSVYISTDGGATYTTSLATGLTGASSWTRIDPILLDAYAGQDVVIVFKGTSNYGSGDAYIYLDDVTVEEAPDCLPVSALSVTATTATTATLGWTETGTATQWQVSVDDGTPMLVSTTPYTITGLTPATTYAVKVRAYCASDDQSEWSSPVSVTTKCEAVTAFPWSENFESYATGNFTATCWTNEHFSGTGTQIFKVSTSTNGSNGTHQLQLPDMSNGTQTKLVLPGMTLPSSNYKFSIDVYRNATGSSSTSEGVRVYASADGEIAGATELGFLYRNYTQTDGGVVTAEAASGWYTYVFPIPFSGSCYIILRGESQWGSSTYMDNFQVLACTAPTGLAYSELKSDHVDLSWTSDADRWDVSTGDDDHPIELTSSDVTIDGTTITYRLEGLDPEHAYTVKVRNNCSSDGISEWSGTITFTTLEACAQPTGVAATNVTNNSATISWTGDSEFTLRYRVAANYDGVEEDFTTAVPPAGWTRLTGSVDAAVAGTAPTTISSGWRSTTYAFGNKNATLNIYGSSVKNWLVTPAFTLAAGSAMSFDLALTDYNNSDAIEDNTAQSDDRFAVLVYADGDWTILREWNNSGSPYVFNDIATDGEPVNDIDISAYEGKNVKFAFYGESTVNNNGDNDLHIDNLTIGVPVAAGSWVEEDVSTATSHNVTGLTAETKYEVQVKALCGTNPVSDPYFFTTLYGFSKDIAANSWYAIASPVHNSGNNETVAGVDNLIATSPVEYDFLRYVQSEAKWQSYKEHTGDFNLERGRGYIYRRSAATTLKFIGERNTGTVTYNCSATYSMYDMKGWNLIGNPYPHEITRAHISQANDYLVSGYYTLQTNGSWLAVASTTEPIAVGQAILVKVTYGGNVTFSETAPATKSAPASTIAFTVSNDEFTDIAYARFSSEEGLPKISHLNPEAPMLSIDGYAIANLNEGTESFPMSFSGNGEYTLTVSGNTNVTGYLHLVDRLTGRDIDLLSTPSYSFTGSPVSDRFTVKLTPDAEEGLSTTRFAIFDGNSLIVNGEGTLEVYDVMGRRLMSAEVTGSEYRIPGSDLHTGVYVLRMNGNSQKIVIK